MAHSDFRAQAPGLVGCAGVGGIVPPLACLKRLLGGSDPSPAAFAFACGSARTPCQLAFEGISLVFLENPKMNGKGSNFKSLIQGAWVEMAMAMQCSLAHFSKWHRMEWANDNITHAGKHGAVLNPLRHGPNMFKSIFISRAQKARGGAPGGPIFMFFEEFGSP